MTDVLAVGVAPDVVTFLQDQGFNPIVRRCSSSDDLCDAAREEACDIVLLGAGTSLDGSAVDLMRKLNIDMPVVRIAGNSQDKDWLRECVQFLDSGGDDMLEADARPEVVAASLRARTRRQTYPLREIVSFRHGEAELDIDITDRRVRLDDQPFVVTGHEMELLLSLVSHPGASTRQQIMNDLYGVDDRPMHSNTIEVFVTRIRAKLGDHEALLKTRRGIGYELLGRVAA